MNSKNKILVISGLSLLILLKPKNSISRGFKNNNPLNLVKSSVEWKGKLKNSQDKKFEQFTTYIYGLRAGILNARYHYNNGKNTITKLINIWAPAGVDKNNPVSYAQHIQDITGIDKDLTFPFNKDTMYKIVKGMEYIENGSNKITQAKFLQAWQSAGLK